MADLTRLVDSADCATAGCPNEADGHDGLCRTCRADPARRAMLAPSSTAPGALAHLTDEEPGARKCKQDGCDLDAHYSTGPGSGYCRDHGLDRYRAFQARGVATRKARGSYRATSTTEISAAAKAVVAASRQLERAIVRARIADDERDEALDAFRRSITQLLHTANQELPDHLRGRRAA